jgi:N-acetyl sugar amidotransferase
MKKRTCNNCILDSNDNPKIKFDDKGICNHCSDYYSNLTKYYFGDDPDLTKFNSVIEKIKLNGKKSKYDILIGLSGGVDSTYVAYICSKFKLRALAVHLDNGWNSELSVVNIKNILKKTGFDLYTHVINWQEFKSLQKSYFKANVVDIEALTDHAIFSVLQKVANKEKIKYILSGSSITTEGRLPDSWVHHKGDHLNIKAINKKFGNIKINTFPLENFFLKPFKKYLYNIEMIDILDYLPYDKNIAKQKIIEHFKWRDYGGKHYESIFTRFYQAYILPKKFGIDKRKSHYSTLICADQLSREEALELVKSPTYESEFLEKTDYEFVIKKLGFSKKEFENYINEQRREHTEFKSIVNYLQFLSKCKRTLLFWK